MGARATASLAAVESYRVLLCEADPGKRGELEAQGHRVEELDRAIPEADFVIMAVPDAAIASLCREIVPRLKSGAGLIMLDAAAAYLGEIPQRSGITLIIVHPCHPPIFTEQPTAEARRDYFGGVGFQDVLTCLMAGEDSVFHEGIELAKILFAPVRQVHRVTVEQFAILEPAMAEIVVATAARWMKDALEEAVAQGVPRPAAEAFWAGHAQIALAIVTGAEASPFSDAALRAIDWGTRHYLRPEWREIFTGPALKKAIQEIIHPAAGAGSLEQGRSG